MLHEIFVKIALERKEAFRNLAERLKTVKRVVCGLDPNAEIFLFGSVAEGDYNYSSDIDVLVITKIHPADVLCKLWKAGIWDPFQIHVHSRDKANFYKRRAKLIKV